MFGSSSPPHILQVPTMVVLSSLPSPSLLSTQTHLNPIVILTNPRNRGIKRRLSSSLKVKALSDVSVTSVVDPVQAEVTWQIVVGALAGVAPFIVAGIEFSKRIVAQRRCEVCKGSGLVLRDKKYYFKCPGCGVFDSMLYAQSSLAIVLVTTVLD